MPNTILPTQWIDRTCERIAEQLGLHYLKNRKAEFHKQMLHLFSAHPEKTAEEWIEQIQSPFWSPELHHLLTESFTIGETYFYRHAEDLSQFNQHILQPTLKENAKNKTTTHIWSAACSSGEEAYTLAMMCHALNKTGIEASIDIHATDINTQSLQKAKRAIYRPWSFRESMGNTLKQNYFTKVSHDEYRLNEEIRKQVQFHELNLVDKAWPPPFSASEHFDIIFCRNILIYFNQKDINRLIQRLSKCLKPNGWLISSSCEIPLIKDESLSSTRFESISFLQKRDPLLASSRANPIRNIIPTKESRSSKINFKRSPKTSPRTRPSRMAHSSHPARSDQKLLEDAQILFENGHYITVLKQLKEQTFSNPTQALSHSRILGMAAAHLGQHNLAIQSLSKALTRNKTDIQMLYILGTTHLEMKQLEKAQGLFKKILFIDPHYVPAELMLTQMASQTKDVKAQLRHLRNALKSLEKLPMDDIPEWAEGASAAQLSQYCQRELNALT